MAISALRGVRVFDGERLSGPGVVVIDGALIGDPAGPPDDVVDARGAVLLPGFVDAHVHLLGPDDMAGLVAHGVTTGLDMGCWPRERVDAFRGHVPDVRSAGLPAIGAAGPHAQLPGMPAEAILRSPRDAEPFVARRIAEGSDYVKVVVESPGPDLLDQATVDAVVASARAHGKLTVAHAAELGAYRMAVLAGADVVTHVPRDGVLDDDLLAHMVEHHQVAVPTLTTMRAVIAARPRPGNDYAHSRDSVTALHRAGVPVLAGTDAFSAPLLPNPVRHGESLHEELALLVEAGLTPVEAVRAATVLPARHFGLPDRGAVAPGLRADLVLLRADADDPVADIAATRRIARVWCAGVEVTPATA